MGTNRAALLFNFATNGQIVLSPTLPNRTDQPAFSPRMKVLAIVLIAIGFIIGAVATLLLSTPSKQSALSDAATYVGRSSCIECHQQEAEAFHGSHHDLAMDDATDETVRGNFDDQTLTHFGITSRFFKRDGRFFVNTAGPDGALQDFEIKYVFGYEPLQQYMVEFDRADDLSDDEIGRVQVLRLCWDTEGERWFYLSPPDVNQKLEPDDPLHWTGISMRWNTSCADCHSTNFHKNFDLLTKTFRSSFSEIDVSCEACHGPASHHVEIMRSRGWLSNRTQTGLTSLKEGSALLQIETCAKCHSRRRQIADGYHTSQRFADFYSCELLMDSTYHADGQIKDEVYVYGSFLQSKMYHQGIRCTDCHDPHTTKIKRVGNSLCTDCHAHPAAKYDTPLHHYHLPGSSGALCVECHMPSTTYMEVDPRRDHSLRVPRPDLSVAFGTPNACSACHVELDKIPLQDRAGLKQYGDWLYHARNGSTAISAELRRVDQWMLESVQLWYGTAYDGSHYYDQLAATSRQSAEFKGSADTLPKDSGLVKLARDASAPDIIRSTALLRMTESRSETTLEAAIEAMASSRSRIIVGAIPRLESEINRSLDYLQYAPHDQGASNRLDRIAKSLANQLDHELLEVRLSIVRTLLSIPETIRSELLNAEQRDQYRAALGEYVNSLKLDSDIGQTLASLSTIYQSQRKLDDAIVALRRAISIDPQVFGIRSELASVLGYQQQALQRSAIEHQRNRDVEALISLQDSLHNLSQEITQLRDQDHQLLLKELQRNEGIEGIDAIYYRAAMSHYLRGEYGQTEQFLKQVLELRPDNEIYLLAAATFYKSQHQWNQALNFALQLTQIDPEHPGYRMLLEEIERERSLNRNRD